MIKEWKSWKTHWIFLTHRRLSSCPLQWPAEFDFCHLAHPSPTHAHTYRYQAKAHRTLSTLSPLQTVLWSMSTDQEKIKVNVKSRQRVISDIKPEYGKETEVQRTTLLSKFNSFLWVCPIDVCYRCGRSMHGLVKQFQGKCWLKEKGPRGLQ